MGIEPPIDYMGRCRRRGIGTIGKLVKKDNLVEKIIPFIDAATPEKCPHCGEKIAVLSEQAALYIKQAIVGLQKEVEK